MATIVRIKNPTRSTFTAKYDGEAYTVPAGSESIVPIGAMITWAGDPSLRNHNARQKFRSEEVTRLHTKYGAYENEKLWERNKPKVEFYTMDGERIWTVVDDPDGEKASSNLTDEQTNITQTAKIAAMEKQMDEFMGMIKRGELVLSEDAQSQAALDQLGADADEREMEAEALSAAPKSIIVSEPDVNVSGPPMSALDDGTDDEEPVLDPTDDPTPTGPPTDSPKSVKVGRKTTSSSDS